MASFYSKPADYGTYTQAINLDLVNFVMNSKQQKYDYNLAKVESKITDQLGSIDLERTQDKEYFLNKASEVLSSIGDISKLDWSKNGVSRQVDSRLDQVVDDRVLNDTISTRNYRAFQSTLQEKQKKNDGSYSTTNAAYAMDKFGVNEWLQGDSDAVSSIQYEDFTDVGAELKDISENLSKYARVYERTNVVDGGRYLVDEKGTVLTASEVRGIAEAQLSDKAKRQMQINGWGHYDGGSTSTEDITSSFAEYAATDLKKADENISSLDLQIKNLGANDPKSKELATRKKSWVDYKKKRGDRYNEWMQDGSVTNMTTTMEKESVLSNFGNTFKINNVGISNRRADSYQLAAFNNKLSMQRDAQKLMAATAKAAAVKANTNPYQVLDRTLNPGDEGYSTTQAYDVRQQELAGFNADYKSTVHQVMAELTEKDEAFATEIDTRADKVMAEQGITKEAALDIVLEDEIGDGSLITVDLLQRVENKRRLRDVVSNELDLSTSDSFREIETTAANTIASELAGVSNRNIKITDTDGTLTTGAAFMRKNNLTADNINDPENKKHKDHLIKNFYAQMLLEEQPTGELAGFGAALSTASAAMPFATDFGLGATISGSTSEESADTAMFRSRFEKIMGGPEKASAYMEQVKKVGAYDTNKGADAYTNLVSFGSAGLAAPFANLVNPDDAFDDDAAIRESISADKVRAGASKRLNQGFGGAELPGALLVRSSAPQATLLKDVLNSPDAILSGGASGMFDKGSSVTLVDIGNGVVRASVMDVIKNQATNQYVTIPKSSLPPEILAQVNFETENRGFAPETMTEAVGSTQLIDSNNLDVLSGIAKVANIPLGDVVDLASPQGFEKRLSAYDQVIGTKENPSQVRTALTNMVEAGDLKMKIKKVRGKFYNSFVKIDSATETETAVYTSPIPIDPTTYKTSYYNTKYAAPIALNSAIQRSLSLLGGGAKLENVTFLNDIVKAYGDKP